MGRNSIEKKKVSLTTRVCVKSRKLSRIETSGARSADSTSEARQAGRDKHGLDKRGSPLVVERNGGETKKRKSRFIFRKQKKKESCHWVFRYTGKQDFQGKYLGILTIQVSGWSSLLYKSCGGTAVEPTKTFCSATSNKTFWAHLGKIASHENIRERSSLRRLRKSHLH